MVGFGTQFLPPVFSKMPTTSNAVQRSFKAVVTRGAGGNNETIEELVDEPGSLAELKIKTEQLKVDLKVTKEQVDKMKADEETKGPARGYKRPQWDAAPKMQVRMGQKRTYIDVELTDAWPDLKELACEALGVARD